MKRIYGVLVLSIWLGALGLSAGLADTFPFNGGFELVNLGEPVGWELEGPWFVRSEARKTGRNGILLRADYTQAGQRMISQGYHPAKADDIVNLRLNYICQEGQLAVGFLYCDALGRDLGYGPIYALFNHDDWHSIDFEVPLEADEVPAEMAAVKVVVQVLMDGTAARFDDLEIVFNDATGPAAGLPRPPALTAARPNLLVNPALQLRDDRLAGWTQLEGGGFNGENARLLPADDDQATGQLQLSGSDEAAGWLADPVVVDIGVPYELTWQNNTSSLMDGESRVVLRVLDPQAPDTVWLQLSQPLEAACEARESELLLPRILPASGPALAQVGVVLAAGAEGCVAVSEPALRPQLLSLTVRGVATAGGFRKPSDVSLFVSAVNNSTDTLRPRAHLKVFNADGVDVAYEGRDIVIGSRSAAYFPYAPKLTEPGDYELLVRVMEKGLDLGSTRFRFKVAGDPPPAPVADTEPADKPAD